jgi:hypothetical protein
VVKAVYVVGGWKGVRRGRPLVSRCVLAFVGLFVERVCKVLSQICYFSLL